MNNTEKSKGLSSFSLRLLTLASVLMFVGAIGCLLFYKYAQVYEKTRPELVMDRLLETMSSEELLSAARGTAGNYISRYEDAEKIFDDYYQGSIDKSKALSYAEDLAVKFDDRRGFTIKSGNANLYSVILVPDYSENPGFGRHYWKTESISIADFTTKLSSAGIEIYAPAGEAIFVNSIPVGSDIYAGEEEYPGMAEIEHRFTNPPTAYKYCIPNVYGNITVTDSDEKEISAVFDSDKNVYQYVLLPENLNSVTISAPAGVTVTLCGAELTHEDGTVKENSIFNEFLSYTEGNEWDTIIYSFDNLYSEPQVSAVDALGNQLQPIVTSEGNIAFFYPNDENVKFQYLSTVEQFFDAYMGYSSTSSYTMLLSLLSSTILGTRLFKYFRYSTEAMIWASNTSVDYDELEYSNFKMLGDKCFYCTVQYSGNFTAKSWYENYSYKMKNGYELLFVFVDGYWHAAEMSAF